ncbi:HAD-IB family phosphatase [Actinoplanes sp. NPDC004185]
MSTYPLTTVEQARVLRPAVPDRPGQRRHQAVVDWNLDGTLTHRDTLLPFLRQVCGPLRATRAVAAAASRRLTGTGHDGAKALLQQLPGGLATAEVDAGAQRYAHDLLTERLRADCLHRWQWHRHHGHRLVIASWSPDPYVRHLGRLLGADTVTGTQMVSVNGRLTGQVSRGDYAAPKGPGEWRSILPSGRPARSGRTEICPLTVTCSTLPTSPSGYARGGISTR